MARIHVLSRAGLNVYSCIVHAPTPAGNNVVGVAWSTAIQNSGNNTTQLTIGNGPGQITNAEANQVTAGTMIEATFPWEDNPLWTNAERTADLTTRAAQAVAIVTADLQEKLRFFGHTVA